MKAMVLAAGRGTRLRPLTDRIPKPMIPIGGRPLLEHVVRLLSHHGFDDLVINLSHLPDVIRDHFGDGSTFDVSIHYSFERDLLGTAGALRPVADHFRGDDFLVYYADNLTNVDLAALWKDHQTSGAVATIGLLWMPESAGRGIVGIDGQDRIDRWLEKPEPHQVFDDYLINGGIYALQPQILDAIPSTEATDFALDVIPKLLADGEHLCGHRLQGQLLSTDTPERYEATQRAVESGLFPLP